MKRTYLLLASLLVSIVSFAQWTKPAAPKAQPLEVGAERYLFNIDAEGFLVGANDWGTRASLSPTLGHKFVVEEGTANLQKDPQSYYLKNYVLQGGMANQWGYMFLDALDAIYVDNTKDGKKNNQYTFDALGDNVYKIGLSLENESYTSDLMAYLGINPQKADTRLYFCDAATLGDDGLAACQLRWIFTTEEDYNSYITARANYDAAVELAAVLDKAKALNVDCADAQAVYDNTSSTAEQLTAAKDALEVKVREAEVANASPESPAEVLAGLGIATDFNDGNATGWTSTTGAQNKQASNGNNAKDFSVTGNHYENWNPSAFTVGKISATASGIPNGVYHLNALAFTNTGKDTYLYAGDSRTAVTATQIDIDQAFDCYTVVSNGSVEIGLEVTEKGPNWVGLDNVYLYYLGNSAESFTYLTEKILASVPDYEEMKANAELVCQASVYDAYVQAKADLKAATADNYATALKAFNNAISALEKSATAYQSYKDKVEEAQEWLQNCTAENEAIDILGAYTNDNEAEGYNGNGTASNILEKCELTSEQIEAETKYLEGLLYNAKSNSMADGDDCTNMLSNPNFAVANEGWTGATTNNISWPAGDTSTYPVMEAKNVAFNLYQTLTGLQNGLYELDLQSAFRPGESYFQSYDETTPYAYINDYEAKVPCGKLDEDAAGISSAEEASAAFAEGKFATVVYGLVTDGTMKVGLTNKVRTFENCCYWAGGLKLIFRAKNEEGLKTIVATLAPSAEEKKTAACGQPEIEALTTALENAQNATEAAELYDAVIALKSAMDAVDAGVTSYRNLEIALTSLRDAIDNAPTTTDAVTLSSAKTFLDATLAAFTEKSLSSEEADEAIEQANKYVVAIKMGKSIASEDNPVDYTTAIINNNFDPSMGDKSTKRIDGWVVDGALNGYKEFSCSFNKGTFDLHQDLTGLPKGKYKVTVHTYYRAGSFDEEAENINAGKDTHLMKLYTTSSDGDFEANVVNLSEGSTGVTLPEGIGTSTINGITVPNGTSASVACFNAGLFLNELVFTVGEDGKATIGLKLPETIGTNDYTVVGAWNLWYMGAPAEKTEQDVTSLIVNNNFDPSMGDKSTKRIDGWVVDGALNGYKEYSCSFNKGTFDLHQDLTGLPKGDYKVTVHTYYRAGSFDEEAAAINEGKDTHLMKLYANTAEKNYETSVMNLSEGSTGVTLPEGIGTSTINGITVPNGTSASVACFNAGLFLNELEFTVGDDGKATIGLKLPETIGTNDYTVVGQWNLYYYGESSEKELEETEVSDLIVNRTFDPSKGDKSTKYIEGWVVDGALNGYKENTCSFNKGTFSLTQKLTGLPEGTYKVTVHTYYRAGSFDEEAAAINEGKDTHLMKFFAQADEYYEKPVVNLSEGSTGVTLPEGIGTSTINGITVPNGTSASVACFNAGLFLNELPFYVSSKGEATIGLKLEQTIGTNDYTVVGEWNLYYYGSGNNVDKIGGGDTPTAIETIADSSAEATPVAFYNLNGVRLSQPQRGINIIKMSDGRCLKVMVK